MLLYPFGLVGILYDAMRFVRNAGLTPSRVHVCSLHALEQRFFGVAGTTIPEWWARHASLPLDVYCAIPYGSFVFACIGFAVYLFATDVPAMRRFAWAFLFLNVLGFATYHVYPAAPPWYYETHGCFVDLAARASEGPNLARVDQLLGIGYFHALYGRASDVFGAIPSLHVAYPLLIALEAIRRPGWFVRIGSISFFLSMVFAAVYLQHHWVIDVVVGLAYAISVHAIVSARLTRFETRRQQKTRRLTLSGEGAR